MKNTTSLFTYLGTLFFIMVFLYSVAHFLGVLNFQYFQGHEAELTTTETFTSPDESVTTNYYYDKTPYENPYLIMCYTSFIITLILVFLFSIKFFRQKIDKKHYKQSLSIPTLYGATNIVYFLFVMDKSFGWEYYLGIVIICVEFIIVFSLIASINAKILLKKQRPKIKASRRSVQE